MAIIIVWLIYLVSSWRTLGSCLCTIHPILERGSDLLKYEEDVQCHYLYISFFAIGCMMTWFYWFFYCYKSNKHIGKRTANQSGIYWLLPLVTRKKVEGCMPTNTLASLARWGMQVFCLTPKETKAQLLTPSAKTCEHYSRQFWYFWYWN